jgi:hypothetical protein
MRKLFWCGLTCAVMLAGSVISTAHFAARHPESIIGRVLRGASYAALIVNPVGGLEPLAQQVRAQSPNAPEALEAVAGDPLPAEPEPVAEEKCHALCAEPDELTCKPVAPGPIAETGGAAPIVIREDEKPAVTPPMPQTALPPDAGSCPVIGYEGDRIVQVAAPVTMPPCEDSEDAELLPMPKPEPEVLPMPHPEEEQEETGWMDLSEEQLLNYFRRGLENQGESENKDEATPPGLGLPPAPEGREDADRHQDYPGCPHGGCPRSGKPGAACPSQPAGEEMRPAGHQAEEPSDHVSHSALRKLSIFRDHVPDEEPRTHEPEVDTMEYRSSDLQLYDFGHGPL